MQMPMMHFVFSFLPATFAFFHGSGPHQYESAIAGVSLVGDEDGPRGLRDTGFESILQMERRADAEERQMDRWRKKQPPQEKDRWTKRAVCMVGNLRTFSRTFRSTVHHFSEDEETPADFFAYVFTNLNESPQSSSTDSSGALLEEIPEDEYTSEEENAEAVSKFKALLGDRLKVYESYPDSSCETAKAYGVTFGVPCNAMNVQLGWVDRCFQEVLKSDYTEVIRTRPDILIFDRLDGGILDVEPGLVKKGVVKVAHKSDSGEADWFFVASRPALHNWWESVKKTSQGQESDTPDYAWFPIIRDVQKWFPRLADVSMSVFHFWKEYLSGEAKSTKTKALQETEAQSLSWFQNSTYHDTIMYQPFPVAIVRGPTYTECWRIGPSNYKKSYSTFAQAKQWLVKCEEVTANGVPTGKWA